MSERLSDEPLEPEFDPGLPRRRSEHGGMPRRDDDEFSLAAERDTEWPQAWRITRLTTCRLRPTLRRQEFPKQSIWRSEGCWATPQSTRRTADFARENLTRQPSVPTGQAPRGRQTRRSSRDAISCPITRLG